MGRSRSSREPAERSDARRPVCSRGAAHGSSRSTALEAVRRIGELFDLERETNGMRADARLAARRARAAPLVADLERWMRAERTRLSRHAPVAKAMNYMLKRWEGFSWFLEDGRLCLTNNAAERALRGVALGRRAWLFAGSDRGGERTAFMYSLIGTAKLNEVDPQAWLTDALGRIADTPRSRLDEFLPWNWGHPLDASPNRLTVALRERSQSAGSTTNGCSSRLDTSRPPRPRRASTSSWRTPPSQRRTPNEIASCLPGRGYRRCADGIPYASGVSEPVSRRGSRPPLRSSS